jgi:hypothetical protein
MTATAILLASFDVRSRTSRGTVSSSDPAGLPNEDAEKPGSRLIPGYLAKSISALVSSMVFRRSPVRSRSGPPDEETAGGWVGHPAARFFCTLSPCRPVPDRRREGEGAPPPRSSA